MKPPSTAAQELIGRLVARCRFPRGGDRPRECAVSGGADSLALLVLARSAGLDVVAVHVDHGIRSGSAHEADLVERAAERFGAGFDARRVEVADGPNLEARAREARHAVLAPDALLGHTLDDQAETVLLFLLRGTGPSGLAAMDSARRPLLGLRRSDTVALCAALDLDTVQDPSNDDPRFTRNRVRHELLPLMDDISQREVAPLLARTASLQREAMDALEEWAARIDPTDARAVATVPQAVGTLALRSWWCRTTGIAYGPDAAAMERMLAVAVGECVGADVGAGWHLSRTTQRLRLERT